jgi:tRNA-2-methylthio-N6-dimethylallyladenosine synthase
LRIRRTIAGDAWDRLEAESCGVPSHGAAAGAPGSVSLGLPTLRLPDPRVDLPAASGSSTTPIYDVTDGER